MTTVDTGQRRTPFGLMLRDWRRARGMSQLSLALDCGVSQRHLSFLESGRSRPSRGMVLHLASALALPLRDQNTMLLAAGFAPAFGERALDAPELQPVMAALDRILAQQEPFPALVVDRIYNLVRSNAAATELLQFLFAGAAAAPPADELNLAYLLLAPDGMRPAVENWEEIAIWLIRRLRAEALLEGQSGDGKALMERLLALPDVERLARAGEDDGEHPPVLLTNLAVGGVRLSLFSMIASLGTPLDAGLQELRIELFYPGDRATEDWFRAAAASRTGQEGGA